MCKLHNIFQCNDFPATLLHYYLSLRSTSTRTKHKVTYFTVSCILSDRIHVAQPYLPHIKRFDHIWRITMVGGQKPMAVFPIPAHI